MELEGLLEAPPETSGEAVSTHGSGANSKRPRNDFVAGVIRQRGRGTRLFDLLTEADAFTETIR